MLDYYHRGQFEHVRNLNVMKLNIFTAADYGGVGRRLWQSLNDIMVFISTKGFNVQ